MLTFLKLGGSLITEKGIPYSPRKSVIKRIGIEIIEYNNNNPSHQLLIGHGSGSFGHAAAANFHTIEGVQSPEDWRGFQQVWWAARQLNQIVCELLVEVGLPIICLPASSAIVTSNRENTNWLTEPIATALNQGLVPIIYGDVIFDKKIGGTILSTEELFTRLIPDIYPDRILLAGRDEGVFRDFPENNDLLKIISPQSFNSVSMSLENSASLDVTGGMAAKVKEMIAIVEKHKTIQVEIFSGEVAQNVSKALTGKNMGTTISAQ